MKPLLLLDPEKLTPADRQALARDGFDPRTEREAFFGMLARLGAMDGRIITSDAAPEDITH